MGIRPDLVREMAAEAGFDLVRFGPPEPGPHGPRFAAWLEAGRAGEMHYLHRNRERILDPGAWLPSVRSSIDLALDYGGPEVSMPGGGKVARYAAGRDYHRFLGKAVNRLRGRLEAEGVPRQQMKGGTDAVPILERALAAQAGIGFLAKSAMVISPTLGPYLLLAELLTPLELPPDGPSPGSCGTCTACLDACPTGAIVEPFQVDSRTCLSYTTIELRGFIPEGLREAQGDRFFGCDVCLEVCPFTSRGLSAQVGRERPVDLQPHRVVETWTMVDVLEMTEAEYADQWVGTAMRRATRTGLRRNAAVVLGNRGDPSAVPALTGALEDEDPVVRGHAAWALGRIDPSSPTLDQAHHREPDSRVRGEIRAAMGMG